MIEWLSHSTAVLSLLIYLCHRVEQTLSKLHTSDSDAAAPKSWLIDWLPLCLPRRKNHRGRVEDSCGPTEDFVLLVRASAHDWSNFKNPHGPRPPKRQNHLREVVVENSYKVFLLAPAPFFLSQEEDVWACWEWKEAEIFQWCGRWCECSSSCRNSTSNPCCLNVTCGDLWWTAGTAHSSASSWLTKTVEMSFISYDHQQKAV